MSNSKDPDNSDSNNTSSMETDETETASSSENEAHAANHDDAVMAENGLQNSNENTNNSSEMPSSAESDTDIEDDEGVNLSDLGEEEEIEFSDPDDNFDETMTSIVKELVIKQHNMIAADIESMRKDVAESKKALQESEDLVNEVMDLLERKSPGVTTGTENGTSSPNADIENNVDEVEERGKSTASNQEDKMEVDENCDKCEIRQTEDKSCIKENCGSQLPLEKNNVSVSKVTENKGITDVANVLHNFQENKPMFDPPQMNPPEIMVNHAQLPQFKVKLQPKKAPVIVRDVRMPGRFTPPPTKRDPSTLDHPPIEPMIRFKPSEGVKVWAMRGNSLMDPWEEAKIIEIGTREVGKGKSKEFQQAIKVKFLNEDKSTKFLTTKQIAYSNELQVRIPTGTRVIAVYKDEDQETGDFFPAIVAEAPKVSNKNRYLMFFDDGYAVYLEHKDIRVVYNSDQDVWKDVDKNNREFVRDYIQQLPNKYMITLKEGDKVRTELNGKIVEAEVNEVDGSLAQMVFPGDVCEWVFRGSKRFEPMSKLKEMIIAKKRRGTIRTMDIPLMEPQPFTDHFCQPDCLASYPYNPSQHKTSNPLRIPIHLGWRREICAGDFDDANFSIIYTAPCGRRLRNLDEVNRFLWLTESNLEIDMFAFDYWLTVMREFVPSADFIQLRDISHGKETMPISACNSYDSAYPPNIEYSVVPVPQREVMIEQDPGFLVGCDCADNCENKTACVCRQLTIQSTVADPGARINSDAGYVHRRLQDVVLTGIYECNKTCKCSTTCQNRLVQFPIRSRLQIFRTSSCGWGIRALDDLPQGAFICTYVGKLYGPDEGNAQGKAFGDMYFADLDMIDNVERMKEGYESDPEDDEGIEDDGDSEEEEKPKAALNPEESQEENKVETSADSISNELTEENKTAASAPTPVESGNKSEQEEKPKEKFKSVRKMFGPDEDVYIMDAMTQGNIGRYLNHSCNPNVFVQNVFVDSHDLRFPTIAFFTLKYVPAGVELCWNYNYVVDSVEGKQINCNCGAENCKGRLL